MSKTLAGQKRSLGKRSPLSKRPKLDFSQAVVESTSNIMKDSMNGFFKGNQPAEIPEDPLKKVGTTSDWDDEFSGDMLEKVCLIADLSQAMVNNEPPVPKPIEPCRKMPTGPISNYGIADDLEKLKLENEKLKESFKTKEGEVQILRSQLKQQQEAKQTETLNSRKSLEEMQQTYHDRIVSKEKEFESMKTKLQFKDLEVKSLTERCRQLESSSSKMKLVEPESVHIDCRKSLFSLTQAITSTQQPRTSEKDEDIEIEFAFPEKVQHDGRLLADLVCPELFRFIKEPSIVPLYTFRNGSSSHMSRLDFDKREKYKWSGLPKQTVFVKDSYDLVSSLFHCQDFSEKQVKTVIENIFETCTTILNFQKQVFVFLESLHLSTNEFDDADQSLLENEDRVDIVTVKHLLDGKKLKLEECGIEARRTLALVLTLIQASDSVLKILSPSFFKLLKDLAASIGNLRRPLRYTGLLVGISLIVKQVLQQKNLPEEQLLLLSEVVEEVIFCRPKLDVLREVVRTLQVGRHHLSFLTSLCRKGTVESCALYMDSKLHQAMFFTKDACPLKLLCKQIMGLSCLPSCSHFRWDIASCVVKWLQLSMDADHGRTVRWLPFSSSLENEDRCFDVTECLVYLLNLCIRDFKQGLHKSNREELIRTIGNGALLLRRIFKLDQRLIHDNMHNLRFAVELKSFKLSKELSPVQLEAITWIVELLESDLKNQEGCGKQSVSDKADTEIVKVLKINDDVCIF